MEMISSFFQSASYPTWVGMGIAFKLFVAIRQFNRRGWGGLQHFSNYLIDPLYGKDIEMGRYDINSLGTVGLVFLIRP